MCGILQNMKMAGRMGAPVGDHADEINSFGRLKTRHEIAGESHNHPLFRNLVTEPEIQPSFRQTENCQINPALDTGGLARLNKPGGLSRLPIFPFLRGWKRVFRHVKVDEHSQTS